MVSGAKYVKIWSYFAIYRRKKNIRYTYGIFGLGKTNVKNDEKPNFDNVKWNKLFKILWKIDLKYNNRRLIFNLYMNISALKSGL